VSHASWRTRFSGDPDIVGRTLRIKGRPYTIVGVAPEGFQGTELFYVPELWLPMMMQPHIEERGWLENWGTHNASILVRAREGSTPEQVVENLNAIGAMVATERSMPRPPRLTLVQPGLVGDMLRTPVRSFSIALMILGGLVLVAACVNLATLFVVRVMERIREMGIKLALGANRWRLSSEIAFEVLILSIGGGLAGLFLAEIVLRTLTDWRVPVEVPAQFDLRSDATVFAFAIVAALGAGLSASLAPAWRAWQTDPNLSLRSASPSVKSGMLRRLAGHGSRLPLRDLLLALQVACCCVLITGGIVALRGLAGAFETDVAMDLENVSVAGFDLSLAGYGRDEGAEFQRRALDAVSSIPGVTSAAFGSSAPLYIDHSTTSVFPEDAASAPTRDAHQASYYQVSPGYFATIGTRILRGRDFSWQDDTGRPAVAIVNETLASRVGMSGRSGWHLRTGCSTCSLIEVVGIVEDGKYQTLNETAAAAIFFPVRQNRTLTTLLVARSDRPQEEIAAAMRRRMANLDADLPLYSVGGLDNALAFVFVPAWAATITLNAFGVLAAMLIATGVYGVSAHTVKARSREISIRVAIGARPGQVLKSVLGRTAALLALGSAAGLGLGLAAARVLSTVVHQATSQDPIVIVSAIVVLSAVALSAAWIPASSALRIDPVRSLRED
jgi:predicted permease